MKRAQRWRYYCDHCGKCGGSGGHMQKHEASCTANPKRVCRYCGQTRPVAELIQVLGYRGTDWKAGMAAHRDPCTRTLWRKVMSFALDSRTPKPSLAGLPVLDRIMDLYLDFAEDRSRRHLPMTMADWADRFELVLRMKEEDILEGPDEVTGEVARALTSGPPQLPRPVQIPSSP